MQSLRWLVGGLVLVVAVGAGWYYQQAPKLATVYVDNTAPVPITVSIDGMDAETIPAHSCRAINCSIGKHHFLVRSGSETLYDNEHDMLPSEQMKYLLNPRNDGRYYVEHLKESRLPGLGMDSPISLTDRYHNLARRVELLQVTPWLPVQADDVLPKRSMQESSDGEIKTVYRISETDYSFLKSAQQRVQVSEEDYCELATVLDQLQQTPQS